MEVYLTLMASLVHLRIFALVAYLPLPPHIPSVLHLLVLLAVDEGAQVGQTGEALQRFKEERVRLDYIGCKVERFHQKRSLVWNEG